MFTAVGSQMPINPYITPSSSPAPKPSAKPTNIRISQTTIIGLTVGMAVLFLLFIVPCCCLQYLAHRQQKKEQRKEVQERATRAARLNEAAGNGSTAEQV
ncbi:hypothetical protein NW765_011735 [Fusarium oxysporum]|nr:hypothetical protein NW765_011735 [Fusarium oxysporum]KAJ4272665.1 hypothetical protein NW764_013286 [Fusarium oxysporum]